MLAGFSVRTERASGPKEVRADPFSAQVNAGNVRLVKGAWNKAYIEELRTFPNGNNDDMVDGSADGFNELALLPELQVDKDAHQAFWGEESESDEEE